MATASNEVDFGRKLEYDPSFKGPLKHRSCTDLCCVLLFIIFLCVWGSVAYFAYRNGDPEKYILPRDSDGHICGVDKQVEQSSYLFYFDLTECIDPSVVLDGCKTPQVCVSSCPSTNWAAVEVLSQREPINWYDVRSKLICRDSNIAATVNSKLKLQEVIDKHQCAKYYIAMKSFYKRCLPLLVDITAAERVLKENHILLSNITNATKIVEFLITAQNVSEVVLEELYRARYYLFGGIGVAILVSLVYIILLRCLSFILIWFSILATFVLLSFSVYYSYIKFQSIPEYSKPNSEEERFDLILKIRDTRFIHDQFQDLMGSKRTWLYLLILSSIVLVVLLFLIMFLRGRIRIAIALIGEASKCVSSIKSSLIFPIFPWSLHLAVIIWSVVVGVYLYSLEDSTYKVTDLYNDSQCECTNNYYWRDGQWCIPSKWSQMCHKVNTVNQMCPVASCKLLSKNPNNFVTYLFLFNIFAYFWSSSFVSALSEMILAATFATWYWTFHKKDLPFFTVTSAFCRTIRYHLGTAIFGSLIISICKFIRFLLEYIERKCKKFDNSFTRAILWTFKCLFWCLHKFIAFVNRNAYIMCAIHGGNFCESAKGAFSLLVRNVVRVVVVDKVTDLLLFLGKALLTIAVSLGAYYVFVNPIVDSDTRQLFVMKYPVAPIVILGVATYLISSTFFRVYSMAIDTLFLCFLEDCERNDGSLERPYFMSKRLRNLLGKKNVTS